MKKYLKFAIILFIVCLLVELVLPVLFIKIVHKYPKNTIKSLDISADESYSGTVITKYEGTIISNSDEYKAFISDNKLEYDSNLDFSKHNYYVLKIICGDNKMPAEILRYRVKKDTLIVIARNLSDTYTIWTQDRNDYYLIPLDKDDIKINDVIIKWRCL